MKKANEVCIGSREAKGFVKCFVDVALILLCVYTVAMIAIELRLGKEHVRGYFEDIVAGRDYPLIHKVMYGINTSIDVALLAAISVLFLVCVSVSRYASKVSSRLWFECSEVLFFLFAACDERFMIHEKLGNVTSVDNSVYVVLLGVVELLLLYYPGRVLQQPWRLKAWLIPVTVCVGISIGLDAAFPTKASEMLTIEDLAKTWAMVFMLIYAWQYCMDAIRSAMRATPDEV